MKKLLLFLVTWCFYNIVNGQSVNITPNGTGNIATSGFNTLIADKSSDIGLYGIRYNGTFTSPTPVLSGENLFRISGGGVWDSNFSYDNSGSIKFIATENFNVAGSGTQISFWTTQNNTYIQGERMVITHDGKVGIGTLMPTAQLEVNGFTKLGINSPKIKVIKLTGTTAATQGAYATPIPHGLNMDKILDIEVIVKPTTTYRQVRGWKASAGFEFDYYFDTNNIQVYNAVGNSANILSKSFTVLITYEE
jgi:hypothetical protein